MAITPKTVKEHFLTNLQLLDVALDVATGHNLRKNLLHIVCVLDFLSVIYFLGFIYLNSYILPGILVLEIPD